MVTVWSFPSSYAIAHYLNDFKEQIEHALVLSFDYSVAMLHAYFKTADRLLGVQAPKYNKENTSKLPFVLFDVQIYGIKYFLYVLKETLKHFKEPEQLEYLDLTSFLALHNALLKGVPKYLFRFAFDKNMPGFLADMLRNILAHFPYIQIVDALEIVQPVLSAQAESPTTFLVVAPFFATHENLYRNTLSYRDDYTNDAALQVSLAHAQYWLMDQLNNYLFARIFRTPASYAFFCVKGKGEELRRFVKPERPKFVYYTSNKQKIGVINYLAIFDAQYFNEIPELADYSAGTFVSNVYEVTAPLFNSCTYYKCCCGECRFLFAGEKYYPMPLKDIITHYKERRALSLREMRNFDTFTFKFGVNSFAIKPPAISVANYEIMEQNERIHRFKRGLFSAFDIRIYAKRFMTYSAFPFKEFQDNYKEYVQTKFADKHADALIKAYIMKLGLYNAYARKIEDANGKKYELADLIKGIATRKFNEVNEAEEDYACEAQAYPYLTPDERLFAAECGMREELLRQLKVHIVRKIQLSNCCKLDIIELSHYIPLSLRKIQRFMQILDEQHEIPLYQRKNTAGPMSIPKREEVVEGYIVRTADYNLLEMYGVGVYQEVYNIYRSGYRRVIVQTMLENDPILRTSNALYDQVIQYYQEKYQ